MGEGWRLLVVETSDRPGHVAVAHGSQLLAVRRLDEARRHARDLAPAVADLLSQQHWKARDLQAVVVSLGPGSYTGLRVGIMSAKALAYATDCALCGVETFQAIALAAGPEVNDLEVLADAQQDRVYWQRFQRTTAGGRLEAVAALQIRDVEEWLRNRSGTSCVGGPWLRMGRGRLPADVPTLPPDACHPRIDCLLHVGWQRLQQGQRDDPWIVEPLYLRRSSAEEKAPPAQSPPGESPAPGMAGGDAAVARPR